MDTSATVKKQKLAASDQAEAQDRAALAELERKLERSRAEDILIQKGVESLYGVVLDIITSKLIVSKAASDTSLSVLKDALEGGVSIYFKRVAYACSTPVLLANLAIVR